MDTNDSIKQSHTQNQPEPLKKTKISKRMTLYGDFRSTTLNSSSILSKELLLLFLQKLFP